MTSNIRYPTEKNVAKYLTENDIEYIHEVPVCIKDEDERIRIWYPDFYLPTLGLYLEVCGTEKDGDEKLRRERIYRQNRLAVLFLHYWRDERDWKKFLDAEINSIERGRVYESRKLKSKRGFISRKSSNYERK